MKIKYNLRGNQTTSKQFLAPSFYINQNEDPIFSTDSSDNEFEISDLNRINLFVGVNNSGKSRFLRGMFNTSFIDYQTYIDNSIDDQIAKINTHEIFSYNGKKENDYLEYPRIKNEINTLLTNLMLKGAPKSVSAYDHVANLNNFSEVYSNFDKLCVTIKTRNISPNLFELVSDFAKKVTLLESSFKFWAKNGSGYKCYIPLFRSLLENENLRKPIYQNIVIKYFDVINVDPHSTIFTGLNLYDGVDDVYRSPGKSSLRKFNSFLSKNFFKSQTIDLIPDKKSNLLLISIGDGPYRSINEIGDGIQAIIIILYPIFVGNANTWFFIEEPETNLHPGFQRIFIETLLNDDFLKTRNHRYFFATHSNHFLDLSIQTEEISIIQFEKESENKHRIKTNVKPNSQILDLLGVKASSVFLANSSIWVEGPTDRKYLSKFLKVYSEIDSVVNLKEDIDYTFFEYAGSLIEHYIFDKDIEFTDIEVRKYINAFSSSSKIFLLADQDNAEGKKAIRDRKLKNLNGNISNFMYSNTSVVEFENLLPPFLLQEFVISALVKQELSESQINQIKFDQKDYNRIGLGKFFQDLLEKFNISHFKFKTTNGDTLETRYKIKLCDFVIKKNFDFEELVYQNPDLKKIIVDLHKFIR